MNWLILYNKDTLQIEQYVASSNIKPVLASLPTYDPDRQAIVGLINPPFEITRDKKVVLEAGKVIGAIDSPNPVQPPEPEPPRSTHWARIDSFHPGEAKPMRVKRTWNEKEYFVDCYVTETIKDQYLAGDIVTGDFVLVHFLEDDADRAIVIAKVYKTW